MTACGDCGEEYPAGEDHRCSATTQHYADAIKSFVRQSQAVGALERKLREASAENERLQRLLELQGQTLKALVPELRTVWPASAYPAEGQVIDYVEQWLAARERGDV